MANKPYPFSVCKECAGGGGGDIDLSGYVQKKEGYGLASLLMRIESNSSKEHTMIFIDGDFSDSAKIPAYTSDLENDSGFVTHEELGDIETALDSIIEIQNSLIGGDSV